MNYKKRSDYEKFNEYSDLLSDESVIYIHADNYENAFKKLDTIFKFCNKKKICPKNVYYDIGRSKYLIDKPYLSKIFRNEENLDIIVYNSSDVNPLETGDYYDIKRYLIENNLGIYDLTYEKYSYERSPMLVWLSK